MSVNLRRMVRSGKSAVSANVNLLYPVLALLLSVFAIAPLWYPGFFQSNTGYAAIYNLIALDQHLGAVLTWAPTWERAFDLLRMDGPLAYWLAEIFHLLGLSYLDAVKSVYALAFVVSAYAIFVLAKRVLKNDAGALLAATIYLYFPYHIAIVYQRGAFGEAVAYALFPFALYALLAIQNKAPTRALIFGAIAMLLLTLTHAGLAILFGIFAALWLFFMQSARGAWLRAIFAIVVGIALGFVLRAPSIFAQTQIILPNGFVPAFVYPFQFLTATWGNAQPGGVFTPERAGEQAAYQIGIAALGFTVLALALLFRNGRVEARTSPAYRVAVVNIVFAIVLIVLMTPWVEFLWNFIFSFFVQSPFQLLSF
ncbi:MAG: glycosyltransferase family 39 protein, partial [Anaerolineales bacterium]|nr:glycosyltransferase family 39 protein [Anaerolineales bacterium]